MSHQCWARHFSKGAPELGMVGHAIVPATQKAKVGSFEVKASLGNIVSPCLKKTKKFQMNLAAIYIYIYLYMYIHTHTQRET
jgi:hypothetical protein